MTEKDLGVVIRGIAPAVKDYVREANDGFAMGIYTTSARLKVLEERPAARDGANGADGRDADPAIVEALRAEISALRAELMSVKAQPDAEELQTMVKTAVAEAVAQIRVPVDGQNGQDGISVSVDELRPLIAAEMTKAVAVIPRPKDGLSVTVADVEPLIVSEVAKAVSALPPAKDGIGVVDALIGRAGNLVLTLSDGGTKDVGFVVGRDVDLAEVSRLITEEVAKIPHPQDGKDGFGFDDFEEVFDGERTYTRRYKQGDRVKEFTSKVAYVLDRGVYKPDTFYEKGDGVTWGGSFWIAQQDTQAKPGDPGLESRAWRLAVKAGRDGKGEKGEKGMDGKPGKDGKYS